MLKTFDVYYKVIAQELVLGPFKPSKRELPERYETREAAYEAAEQYKRECREKGIWETAYVEEYMDEVQT